MSTGEPRLEPSRSRRGWPVALTPRASAPSYAGSPRPRRPFVDIARPPGVLVVLVIGGNLGALLEPSLSDEHHKLMGQADQRLAAHASRRDRPLLVELPDQRVGWALAEIHSAAGSQRPAPSPGGKPRRTPTRQPAPVSGTRQTQPGNAVRSIGAHESQRPAQRLQLELYAVGPCLKSTSRPARPSWLGEPRCCKLAISASATLVCSGEGSKCSLRQRVLTWFSSHGPRASNCGSSFVVGCALVATSRRLSIRKQRRVKIRSRRVGK